MSRRNNIIVKYLMNLANFNTTIAIADETGFHSPSDKELNSKVKAFRVDNNILIIEI